MLKIKGVQFEKFILIDQNDYLEFAIKLTEVVSQENKKALYHRIL